MKRLTFTPPVVIGINGMDCAGKTTQAARLFARLTAEGHRCHLLHVDDFNNDAVQERIYRAHAAGRFSADLLDLYYRNSIHYPAVAEAIRQARRQYEVTIVEGVFLFKESLRPLLDIKIFLPITPTEARARYAARRQATGDPRLLSVFDDIWRPAFARYCREEQPENISDEIIP